MIRDLISFGLGTGLNWDDDIPSMPKGDSKYRLNVSLDNNERENALSKSLGNTVLKNIIDPVSDITQWSVTQYSTPDRTRFYVTVSDSYLFLNGTYATAGVIICFKTDNGEYRIYHKNSDFTTLASAKNNIIGKVNSFYDSLIYDCGCIVTSGTTTTIYIEILDTSTIQDVSGMNFLYGELGTINEYINATEKDIVGAYYHEKDNELYTFWSSNVDGYTVPGGQTDYAHLAGNIILKYSYNTGLTEILTSESLYIPDTIAKWNRANLIKAAVIGDDSNKILYWTDGVNDSMSININRALNTKYGYGDDIYTDHNTDELRKIALNIIKQQPAYPGLSDYTASSYTSVNSDVISHPVQFIHRYIFADNELSSWSPVTEIACNMYERADGSFTLDVNYSIYRCFIQPPETTSIKKVEFAFRSSTTDNWKTIKTVDYDGSTRITYEFTGSELMEVIDNEETNTLYDNVPLKSGAISTINDNRLLLADNTVGFNNVELDVSTTVVSTEYAVGDESRAVVKAASTGGATYKDITINLASGDGGMVYVVFKTLNFEYAISADTTGMTAAERANYFVNYITTKIVGSDACITWASNVGNELRISHTVGGWIHGGSTIYAGDTHILKLKNGIKYNFGLVYYDLFGRRGYVNEIDSVYIPFYTEQTDFSNNEYFDVVKLEINHIPPSWAYYWGIYYNDNAPKYIQVAVKVSDFKREDGKLRIKVDDIINEAHKINPRLNLSYQYTPGDRIRWIGTIDDVVYSGSQYNKVVNLIPDYIDEQVLGYAGDFNEYVVVNDYSSFISSTALINAATYVLVELYTPQKTDAQTFYFETQYKFPVLNPGTSSALHGVLFEPVTGVGVLQDDNFGITVSDQTSNLPAVCYFDKMDYRFTQHWAFDTGKGIACYVDSQSFSNYSSSRLRNYGRPHIVNPDARQIRLNTIQWSNVFIPNSRVNGLSKFGFDDEKSMNDKYGRISGLEVTGDILHIIQVSKISSIYLGAQLSVDANGAEILSYNQSTILGSSRASIEDFGSTHKYSIIKSGSYVYGFDIQSAVVWRKSNAGVEDISRYKMRNYFRSKVEALKTSGFENIIVVSGYDSFKSVYYITFLDTYNSSNSETLAFHEPTNRWISFYSFIPDMYASIENMQLITFKDGYMYKQESTTEAVCNYFETQYGSEVWVVGNINPANVKTFNSIIENTSQVWDMPDTNSIIVDSDDIEYSDPKDYQRHRGSMQSRLKESQFRYKHGEYHAGFLRDMITTSSTAKQYDLFNGRKLRGKTILCKLENDGTSAVTLRSVIINSNI